MKLSQRIDKLINATIVLLLCFLLSCDEEKKNSVDKFKISEQSFLEGSGNSLKELIVVMEGSLSSKISVSYELLEVKAKFGDDVIQTSGEIEFNVGQFEAIIPVEIIGDDYFELSESFDLLLTYDSKTIVFSMSIEDDDQIENILMDQDGYYTPGSYPSMQLAWSDEFDDIQLSSDFWTYEIGNGCDAGICGWGNQELENYTNDASNVNLDNGMLNITALENAGNYTSARIKTEDKIELQYGRIDVRARLPKGKGIWPAIWMLGENIGTVGWPACGEIDIMELVGNFPQVVHGTVHYDNNGYNSTSGSKSLNQGDFSDQFHVFTIVWDRDNITWYVDNNSYKTFSKSGTGGYPFNNSFFFIINVAVGGLWPGNPDGTTVFPQMMEVDYIRVFQ